MNIVFDALWDRMIDKLKLWGLAAFLILVPLCYTGADDLRIFQMVVFVLASMCYASLYFGNVWLTLFFLYNTALYCWSGGEYAKPELVNIFMGSVLFASSRWLFSRTQNIKVITNSLKIVCLVTISFMILQVFSIDPLHLAKTSDGSTGWGESFNLPVGMFALAAANGAFLALCIPFFIAESWILGLALLIPIFYSRSAGCYLSTAVVLFYAIFFIRMVYFKWKIVYWLLALAVIFGGILFVYKDYSGDKLTGKSRFENWHLFFKAGLASPVFGYGPASFGNLNEKKNFFFKADEDYNPALLEVNKDLQIFKYHSADEGKRKSRFDGRIPKSIGHWNEAHNEYLQLFVERGILGCLIILALFYEVWRRFRISMESKEVRILFGAILVYAVVSITQFPFHLARNALFLPVILGAFFAFTDRDFQTFIKGEPA